MLHVVVFATQLLLVFLKHINIRQIIAHHVGRSMFFTLLIQLSWLVSSTIGIKALLEGNLMVVTLYLLGGVAGSYLNFKIKV